MVVENRVGAAGSIGARACADAEPDGYTICILNNESMVINPLISKNVSFDPKTSLTHVTRLFYLQHVFAVNPARRKELRRAGPTREVEAQDLELHHAVTVQGRIHGGIQ